MKAMPDIIQQLIIKACKDHYQNDHILYLIPQLNVPVKQIDKYQNKTDRSAINVQAAVKLLVLDRLRQIKQLFDLIPYTSIPFPFRKYSGRRRCCIQSQICRDQQKCRHTRCQQRASGKSEAIGKESLHTLMVCQQKDHNEEDTDHKTHIIVTHQRIEQRQNIELIIPTLCHTLKACHDERKDHDTVHPHQIP